jgi:IS30 family transposase
MKLKKRRWYTESERLEMWQRWQQGESLNDIARLFETSHSAIQYVFSRTGGIEPQPRTRATITLSLEEREEISRGLAEGRTLRYIARALNRSPSTISREIARNGGVRTYRATTADKLAWKRALRPKPCKLVGNRSLIGVISRKLLKQWSPQQIAGWLKRKYPNNERLHVSHETIYRSLFVQARGVLKRELIKCLRTRRVIRQPKNASLKGKGLGGIPNAVSISERPASVEDRAVPGHWEGDLIEGSGKTFIATLVERHSRYVMLAKVPSKKTADVVKALIKQAKKLPVELYKSLTWDRGSELTNHKEFTLATNIDVYFCDPSSPWQRGSNENTNRLLRQYFPKGTDLSQHSQQKLNSVARQLNERPRKTLEYETPAERFNSCVASTG